MATPSICGVSENNLELTAAISPGKQRYRHQKVGGVKLKGPKGLCIFGVVLETNVKLHKLCKLSASRSKLHLI
jgi:hypothetical protein